MPQYTTKTASNIWLFIWSFYLNEYYISESKWITIYVKMYIYNKLIMEVSNKQACIGLSIMIDRTHLCWTH